MTQTRPLGAQISHMLKARGVDVIFGIPGVHNQELYRGIEEAGITHVLARHEQGAAFMADGFARATGKAGVCYVITGPGVLNALTPLGQAYSDSVPVLMIASCLDETVATRGQLHQMRDQQGAAATVTAWSETAQTAQAAYALIDRALVEFETQRPRPRALHVPIALLEGPADAPPPPSPSQVAHQHDGAAFAEDVAQAMMAAKRPLVIVGGGMCARGTRPSFAALNQLLEATGAALMTTYAGRPAFDATSPLHFGPVLSRAGVDDVIAQADYVLVLGSELAQVDLWRDSLGNSVPITRVDIDPEVLATGSGVTTGVRVLADAPAFTREVAKAALAGLLDQSAKTPSTKTTWQARDVAAFRAQTAAQVATERPGLTQVIRAVERALPADTTIFSDMTQFAYAAKDIWEARATSWHHPYGFGTLGYALPAAIGGALGQPDRPTCCMIGDYGLQYTLPELGTAVELGLPLPIILWDNGKLGEIEDSMVRAQIAPNAVIQRNPDFLKLAEAYGAAAVQPAHLDEIEPALRAAFDAAGPTVIRLTPDLSV